MTQHPLTVETLTDHDPRLPEVFDFMYKVLYQPFDIAEFGSWRAAEPESVYFVIFDEGRVVGCARTVPPAGDVVRQVRTVAVDPGVQGRGIGRVLMTAVEEALRSEGAEKVWLNARTPAIGFYERIGYSVESDEFINELSGLPHRIMGKSLLFS